MYKTVSIIGGDLRIVNLIELLAKDDFLVYTYGLENSEDLIECENVKKCASITELVGSSEIIIGPQPMMNDQENISAPFAEEKIPIDELISEMSNKNKIFLAGKISETVEEKLKEGNIKSIDLLKREELVVLNTIATAEGTIQLAMENTQKTIHGSNILIMGFGRVGKVLAKMLDGIGAKVSCEARKNSDIAWIKAYGYNPIHLSELDTVLGDYDIIINTIPFQILDENRLKYVKKECTILDLSSTPGGVDRNAARRMGLKLIWALSLPGKVAPMTSAEFIKETLHHILKEL
ncbi:MAG: dipicolinate synthase subunit DpsA [Clostridia bacterium]|jgi:dipicolinate synthase subunit A|nr:dipicolinate synthase subunit DpsA [Clostridia bacterium]